MFKKTLLATLVTAAATPFSVLADDSLQENIVVTATRTAQSIDEALASVDVISAAEIARTNPSDGLDLLSQVAGVDISRSGGRGAAASLYLRGSGSSHTLVLIDGVRQGSATLGEAALRFVDPTQIEKVEIVRGPRSSLYGSDALGGVVQIFTRKTQSNFMPIVSAGYGSNNTKESAVSLGGDIGPTYLRFGINHYETGGIDNHVNDTFGDADEDASRMTTVSLMAKHTLEDESSLSFDYFRSAGENEYDGGFFAWGETAPYSENIVESLNVSYSNAINDSWSAILTWGQSKDKSDARDDKQPTVHDYFYTKRHQVTWQNDVQLGESLSLTAGLEYFDDKVKSSQEYVEDSATVNSRYNQASFVQLQGDFSDSVSFVAALRRDDNEQFGLETTYNAALGFELNEEYRLIVSHGTAFKAPTFNDLYWPETPWSSGNPDLKPETASNVDVELRGNYSDFSWSLSAYKNRIEDLIEWAPTDSGAWTPSNIKDADIVGYELSAETNVVGWSLNSALTYMEPIDEATDQILRRRAKTTLTLQLAKSFGPVDVNLDWKAQSHRYDDQENTERLAGYGIVGVNLGYRFTDKVSIQLDLDNLFDKDYQLSGDYNTEGFQSLLSVKYAL